MTSQHYARIMLALLVLVARPISAQAQACSAVLSNISQQATQSVWTTNSTCSVPDGGFIKTNTAYRLHAKNEVTGTCQTRAGAQCAVVNTFTRYGVQTDHYIDAVSQGRTAGISTQVQSYDSCAAPPCTGVNTSNFGINYLTPTTPAIVEYTTTSYAAGGTSGPGATYCNMGASYGASNAPFHLNIVRCEPIWNLAYNPAVVPHLPPTSIELYIPSTLWNDLAGTSSSPANQAASDWTTALSAVGVNITPVSTDCGTGGNCITLGTGTVTGGCAEFTRGSTNPTTGVIESASTITIATNYTPGNRTRRTIAHELGHALGLAEYTQTNDPNGCNKSLSVMAPVTDCTSTTNLSLSPTGNDTIPTKQSTFGDGVRAKCGF